MHIKMYLRYYLKKKFDRDLREVCYNVTNYVVKDLGRMGNHEWVEVILGEDCSYFSRIVLNFSLGKFEAESLKKYEKKLLGF